MTNEYYVRQSANKYGWKKYYSTLRPVSMGTQPKDGFMDEEHIEECLKLMVDLVCVLI